MTQNGYTYANNNPVIMVDPDGHYWVYVAAAFIGGASRAGKYYLKNKRQGKKSTWKGAGKEALKDAGKGLMWTGVGRALGLFLKES